MQAITARDSMAKSLYSALFDWIVLRINHALLNKKDMEESVSVRRTKTATIRICIKDVQGLTILLFLHYFSVYPLVCLISSASKTLRPTALSNSASTTPTSSFSITSTSTSLNLNRLVGWFAWAQPPKVYVNSYIFSGDLISMCVFRPPAGGVSGRGHHLAQHRLHR